VGVDVDEPGGKHESLPIDPGAGPTEVASYRPDTTIRDRDVPLEQGIPETVADPRACDEKIVHEVLSLYRTVAVTCPPRL
jgi:hypothetical protein